MSETSLEQEDVAAFNAALDAEATAAAAFPNVRTRLKLENSQTLRTHVVKIFAEARAGKITSLEATRLCKVLREVGRLNAEVGVEKRLERLEAHLEGQRAGRGRGR
jgi:hypothetical protein